MKLALLHLTFAPSMLAVHHSVVNQSDIRGDANKSQANLREVMLKYSELRKKWNASHANSTLRFDAVAQGRCERACGDGVDSSCLPECEVKMFQCIENFHPDESALDQCFEKVEAEFKKFGANWNATYPYLVGRRASSKSTQTAIIQGCGSACGTGVDSSCVPKCETEMYWCLDHDPPYEIDDQKKCMDEVVARFKKFGQEWEQKHPYFLAKN